MEAYFRAFINYKQDNWARLIPMAKFAYYNAKHNSMGYMSFKLNCEYYQHIFYKENVDPRSRSKKANELTKELRNVMATCRKNLQHAQKLQKRAHNKETKLRNYTLSKKVWLNSKYIKTKRNRKLEAKFFESFRVLHPVGSQAYKLELPKWWKIHNVFHIFLLEQNITRKGWVDKKIVEQLEFKADGNNEEYEVEGICDSAVYVRESKAGHLLGLYYLVS